MKNIEIKILNTTLSITIIDDMFGPINNLIVEDYPKKSSPEETLDKIVWYINLFDYPYRKITITCSADFVIKKPVNEITAFIEQETKLPIDIIKLKKASNINITI